MHKHAHVTLSVSDVIDKFTYRVEQASPIAGLSVCSVLNVRHFLSNALRAICGYCPRDDFMRGWGYEYLTSHGLPTLIAEDLLWVFINQLDEQILEALRDRPYYNNWYVEIGKGMDVCTLYFTRLGIDGDAISYSSGSN